MTQPVIVNEMGDLFYVRQNPSEHGFSLRICGLKFQEFVKGVERPLNLLVFRSLYPNPVCFHEINFDGIRDNQDDSRFGDLDKILQSPEYLDGDFNWIEFNNENRLIEIDDDQLAEICFLSTQGRALNSPFIDTLENRFVYFGHDNGFMTSILIRDRSDRDKLLRAALQNKARIFGFTLLDDDWWLDKMEEGLLFDFRAISDLGLPVRRRVKKFSFDTIDVEYESLADSESEGMISVEGISNR